MENKSMHVRPKKSLGQHFLKNEDIAKKIAEAINPQSRRILEVGPGTGVLTKYLLEIFSSRLLCVEKDKEAFEYLIHKYKISSEQLINADFLQLNLRKLFEGRYSVIGNFPYNISTQILIKVLEERDRVDEVVGMFQKEVAERIISDKDKKSYGILSVLLKAFYETTYLFTVDENMFEPAPKVKSAVIKLIRNKTERLDCDEKMFFRVVKTTFNHRRKMLRNTLKVFGEKMNDLDEDLLQKRPENLSVEDFVMITKKLV